MFSPFSSLSHIHSRYSAPSLTHSSRFRDLSLTHSSPANMPLLFIRSSHSRSRFNKLFSNLSNSLSSNLSNSLFSSLSSSLFNNLFSSLFSSLSSNL